MFAWQRHSSPVASSAYGTQPSPVNPADSPSAVITPSWRVAGFESDPISRSTASAAEAPSRSISRPRGPKEISTNDCVATAPTPGSAKGTMAPTAGQAVKTATPSSPVSESRATIDAVMASLNGLRLGFACGAPSHLPPQLGAASIVRARSRWAADVPGRQHVRLAITRPECAGAWTGQTARSPPTSPTQYLAAEVEASDPSAKFSARDPPGLRSGLVHGRSRSGEATGQRKVRGEGARRELPAQKTTLEAPSLIVIAVSSLWVDDYQDLLDGGAHSADVGRRVRAWRERRQLPYDRERGSGRLFERPDRPHHWIVAMPALRLFEKGVEDQSNFPGRRDRMPGTHPSCRQVRRGGLLDLVWT